MHRIMHARCGKPAFLYTVTPVAGAPICRDNTRHLDGTTIHQDERMTCGSCTRTLDATELYPDFKVYDMTSTEDMEKLYGPYRHDK